MNSKQAAKLAFGNPSFFDFLAPVTNFLRPVTTPLVQTATRISAPIVQAITGGSPAVSAAFASPEAQRMGQDLAAIGIVSGAAITGGAVAAPLVAGLSLPSLGSLGALGSVGGLGGAVSKLGNLVQSSPEVTDFLLNGDSDSDDVFGDAFDEDDAGPEEE